jgi:hypothetical protein
MFLPTIELETPVLTLPLPQARHNYLTDRIGNVILWAKVLQLKRGGMPVATIGSAHQLTNKGAKIMYPLCAGLCAVLKNPSPASYSPTPPARTRPGAALNQEA